tara:strand:- start:1778 stop:1972 length:195 start_codon:yes stop_codon:yes gene_type:complete
MLEVIGFIVWVVFTLGLTFFPFIIIALSGLGGGMRKVGFVAVSVSWSLAIYSWYYIFSAITITI